jgi:hypothetical protein
MICIFWNHKLEYPLKSDLHQYWFPTHSYLTLNSRTNILHAKSLGYAFHFSISCKTYIGRDVFHRYFHLIVNLLSMPGVILNDETVHQLCKQAVSQVYFIESSF